MLKHLHLYTVLHDTCSPIAVNFNKIRFISPNNVDSNHTDIYFGKDDMITVCESYEEVYQLFNNH